MPPNNTNCLYCIKVSFDLLLFSGDFVLEAVSVDWEDSLSLSLIPHNNTCQEVLMDSQNTLYLVLALLCLLLLDSLAD